MSSPCVEIKEGWTSRQKWNYVKNLHQPNYAIDANGDEADSRAIDDEARIADFVIWDGQYNTDYNNWITSYSNIAFERWLQWQYEIGTTVYGNLPQHKRHDHDGHCWMPCPYSADSSDERSSEMLGFTPTKNDHGIYYMKTESRAAWGFECTYSGCPHIVDYGNDNAYFYV